MSILSVNINKNSPLKAPNEREMQDMKESKSDSFVYNNHSQPVLNKDSSNLFAARTYVPNVDSYFYIKPENTKLSDDEIKALFSSFGTAFEHCNTNANRDILKNFISLIIVRAKKEENEANFSLHMFKNVFNNYTFSNFIKMDVDDNESWISFTNILNNPVDPQYEYKIYI